MGRNRLIMTKLFSVLFLALAVGAAPAPTKVRVVSLPAKAVVGAPWRVVVSLRPPARATLQATGPSKVSARLSPLKQKGRYAATLRFPATGTFRIAARVGKRTVRLGSVSVDIRRDPLIVDPIAIAVEPSGALIVSQLRQGALLRIEGGRVTKLADGLGFHVYVADGKVYLAGQDGAVYRLDGSSLTRLTPNMDAGSVAVDAAGNLYVTLYVGWVKKIAPDGTVTTIAGDGTEGYAGDGGLATAAKLFHPHAIAIGHDGALYIADTENRRIRRVDLATRIISTFGGDVGITVGLAVGPDGSIYSGDVVRAGEGGGVTRTTPDGVTTRIISSARVNDVAVGSDGAVYVNKWEDKRIERLDPATGKLVPVARG